MSFNSSENKHKIHQNSHVTFEPMPTTRLM